MQKFNAEESRDSINDTDTQSSSGIKPNKSPENDVSQKDKCNKTPQSDYFEIDRIISSFWHRKLRKRFYKIKWKNFSLKNATYEPSENIPQAILDRYHAKD